MTPMRRDETADAVRDTTRDVGSWLDRLEFPGVEPSGDSDPARSMREDLRVNFYDTVQHWLGDLRHRLRAIEQEGQVEAPAVEEHVAETMARIIDAARDVAASATPPADAREPEPGAELEVCVGASIGVAWSADGDASADVLLRRADVALYGAKRDTGGSVRHG